MNRTHMFVCTTLAGILLLTPGVHANNTTTTTAPVLATTSTSTTLPPTTTTAPLPVAATSSDKDTYIAAVLTYVTSHTNWTFVPADAFATAQRRSAIATPNIYNKTPAQTGQWIINAVDTTKPWSVHIHTQHATGNTVVITAISANLNTQSIAPGTATHTTRGFVTHIDSRFSTSQQNIIIRVVNQYATAFKNKIACAPPVTITYKPMTGTKGLYGSSNISLDPNRGVNLNTIAHELTHHLDQQCETPTRVRDAFIAAQGLTSTWNTRTPAWEQRPVEQWAEAGTLKAGGSTRMPITSAAAAVMASWVNSTPLVSPTTSAPRAKAPVAGEYPTTPVIELGDQCVGTVTYTWQPPQHQSHQKLWVVQCRNSTIGHIRIAAHLAIS